MGTSMEAMLAEMDRKERERQKQMQDMIAEMDEKKRNTGAMGEQLPNAPSATNALDNLVGGKWNEDGSHTLDLKHGMIGQGVRKLVGDVSAEFKKAKELGFKGTVKELLAEDKRQEEAPSASAGQILTGLWEGLYKPFVADPASLVADQIFDTFNISDAHRKKTQKYFDESGMGIRADMTPGERQEAAMSTIANVASIYLGLKAGQSISAGAKADALLQIPKGATNAEILNIHIPKVLEGLAPLEKAQVFHTLSTGVKEAGLKGAVEGVVGGVTLGLSERDVSPESMFQYMKAGAILGAAFEGIGYGVQKVRGIEPAPKNAMYQEAVRQDLGRAITTLHPDAAVAFAKEFNGVDIITPFQKSMDANRIQVFDGLDPRSVPTNLGTKVLTHTRPDGTVKAVVFGDGAWEVAEAKRKVRSAELVVEQPMQGTIVTSNKPLRYDAPLDRNLLEPIIKRTQQEIVEGTNNGKDPNLILPKLLELVEKPDATNADLFQITSRVGEAAKNLKYDAVLYREGYISSVLPDASNVIRRDALGKNKITVVESPTMRQLEWMHGPLEKGIRPELGRELLLPEPEVTRATALDWDSKGKPVQVSTYMFAWTMPDGNDIGLTARIYPDNATVLHVDGIEAINGANSIGREVVEDIRHYLGKLTPATEVGGLRISGSRAKEGVGTGEAYKQKPLPKHFDLEVEYVENTIPLDTGQKLEFSRTGHYVGQEVSYNGKSYIYNGAPKTDRVRLIDPESGKKIIVDKANINDVSAPRHFEFKDGAWKEFNPQIPIDEAKPHLMRDEIMASLSDGDKLLIERNLEQGAMAEMTMNDMLNRNGLYLDGQVLRSLDDPNFKVSIKSHEDLVAFTEKFNAPPNALEAIEGVQGLSNLGMLDKASAGNINLGERGEWVGGRKILDWLRTSPLGNIVAPVNFMYKSLARKTGLDLVLEQANLGRGVQDFSAAIRPWTSKFTMVLSPVSKLKGDMRAIWGKGLETANAAEYRARGLSGRPMTPAAQAIADDLVATSTSVDRQVASRYVTTKLSIQSEFEAGKIGKKEYAERMKMADDLGNYGKPVSEAQKTIAEKLMDVTGRYNEVNGELIWQDGMNDAGLLEVTGLADAVELKTPSRAEFAADPANKITPELKRAWTQYDMLMQELAKEAGIPYQQQMWGYMPHIKKYLGATALDPAVLRRMKIGDPATSTFVHELTRTGFFDSEARVTDPIQATSKYLYSVMRQKHLEPHLVALREKLNEYRKGGIPDFEKRGPTFNTTSVDPRAVKYADKMMEHIEGMVRHVTDPVDMIADANFESWVNNAIGGDQIANRNWTSTWLKWMEYKAQGFKPVAGLRDATSIMQSYLFLYGPERTRRLVVAMNEAAKRSKTLAESGVTAGRLDINKLVGELPEAPNNVGKGRVDTVKDKTITAINDFTDRAAEAGFRASFQPQVYQLFHGAAYIEATKTFADALVQLQSGKIKPEKFRSITSLDLYPQAIEAQFDKMVKAGDFENAVNFIADQTGKMAVGQYGLMNNPMMYKTKAGKLFGQYGQWPLWMLSNLGEGLTQGTPATIGKRAAFLGLSSAAAIAGTQALGLDFNKWSLNPLGMFPLGSSPAFQIGMNFKEAMDFGSPMQEMNWKLLQKQMLYAAKPWPMEVDAILQAGVMAQEGVPLPLVGARLLGAGLDSKRYKMADYNFWDYVGQ